VAIAQAVALVLSGLDTPSVYGAHRNFAGHDPAPRAPAITRYLARNGSVSAGSITVSGQDLDAYMRENIFAPLAMRDTGFVPNAGQFARYAQVHARNPDGSLEPVTPTTPTPSEFHAGGGARGELNARLAYRQALKGSPCDDLAMTAHHARPPESSGFEWVRICHGRPKPRRR